MSTAIGRKTCVVEELLDRFSTAWVKRDVPLIVSCFHTQATYFASVGPSPGERAVGHSAISQLIERVLEYDADTTQTVSAPIIVANSAFWTWTYRHASGDEEYGCDFFQFKDDLIVLKDAYRKTHLGTQYGRNA